MVGGRGRKGSRTDRWSRATKGECKILGAEASRAHGLKKAKSTKPAGLSTAEAAGTPQSPVLRFLEFREPKRERNSSRSSAASLTLRHRKGISKDFY